MAFLAILLVIIGLALTVAWWGLSIWALVFGIVDLVNVGFNGWALAWIIIGAVGILLGLVNANRKS